MSGDANVLKLTKTNDIYSTSDRSEFAFQADNGTIFTYIHLNQSTEAHFYANLQGTVFRATLPGKIMANNSSNSRSSPNVRMKENVLYFIVMEANTKKIFKAELSPPDAISVTEIRELQQDENLLPNGLCCCVRDGKKFVYRICDDPVKDAILVNDDRDIVNVREIHRVLYIRDPEILKFEDNEVEVALPGYQNGYYYNSLVFARDSSPYIYVAIGYILYAIDMESKRIMPCLTLRLNGRNQYAESINGVLEDVISMKCPLEQNGAFYATAKLPHGYFENDYRIGVKRMAERLEMVETVLKLMQMEEIMQIKRELEQKLETAQAEWAKEKEELVNEKEEMKTKLRQLSSDSASVENGNKNYNKQKVIAQMKQKMKEMENMLIQSRVWALESVKSTLKFDQVESLTKPLICIHLENGTLIYFDNAKPFELFTMKDNIRVNVDLKLLEGEYDCSFRGTIGNEAYFTTVRGKLIKFFKTRFNCEGNIVLEQISEIKTSDLSLFKNEPLYFIENSKEWSVYKYNENYTEREGEKFDISEINLLSKYERHFHRGVLYLFRDTPTARVERVNEKVVRVEGPLLDETSFYTPPHSDFLYILNQDQNVLIILNTVDLTLSQHCYEPSAGSNNHSIVGIHDGVLTMAFDGVWGRHLATTKMP